MSLMYLINSKPGTRNTLSGSVLNIPHFPFADVIPKTPAWQEKSGLMKEGEYDLIGSTPFQSDF
jgi:hypothetical protein